MRIVIVADTQESCAAQIRSYDPSEMTFEEFCEAVRPIYEKAQELEDAAYQRYSTYFQVDMEDLFKEVTGVDLIP